MLRNFKTVYETEDVCAVWWGLWLLSLEVMRGCGSGHSRSAMVVVVVVGIQMKMPVLKWGYGSGRRRLNEAIEVHGGIAHSRASCVEILGKMVRVV